jgi:hypothetical protein
MTKSVLHFYKVLSDPRFHLFRLLTNLARAREKKYKWYPTLESNLTLVGTVQDLLVRTE